MNKSVKTDLGNQEIFSRNLKRYLDNSGKTQKEVAAAIYVSTGTFCDWIKGRSYPRMDKVQSLAEYFGISKSDLVENENIKQDAVSEEDQEVLDLFHKLPKEKREFVLSMIRAAIDNLWWYLWWDQRGLFWVIPKVPCRIVPFFLEVHRDDLSVVFP